MSAAPWDPDRPLDAMTVETVLRDRFPDIPVNTVTALGQGWDFEAYLVNDTWVFRFPKRQESESKLQFEIEFLKEIARVSPIPVPVYSFVGPSSHIFPYLIAGYPVLRGESAMGVTLSKSAVLTEGRRLGLFLDILHGHDIENALAMGVGTLGENDTPAGIRRATIEDLDSLAVVIPSALYDRCLDFFDNVTNIPAEYGGPSRLIHRDIGAEHIILSEDRSRIEGIIDWSDVAIGDPAIDFAGLWVWQGDALVEAALQEYSQPADPAMWERIRYIGAHMAVANVSFGYYAERMDYMSAGLAWLGRIFERYAE